MTPAVRLALRAMRPGQWLHFTLLPAAALFAGLEGSALEVTARLAASALVAAACLSVAYGVNSITDRRLDRDAAKNPLVAVETVPGAVGWSLLAAALVGLGVAAVLGVTSFGAAAVSLAAGLAYSLGPRWKALPVVGTAVNAVIFAPLLLVGSRLARPEPAFFVLAVSFLALLTQNQLVHEVVDAEEDAGGGVRTTASLFSDGATFGLVLGIGAAAAAVLLLLPGARLAGLAGAGCLLAIDAALVRWRRVAPSRLRRAHRWMSVAAGLLIFAAALADRPGA